MAIIETTEASVFNRTYILEVLATTIRSQAHEILQIRGDGIIISFHSSSGPFRPSVTGQTISFGGHKFEVLATPNEYRVDGNSHKLPPPGIYSFSDGEFAGRLR